MNAQKRNNSQCKISRCTLRNFLLAAQTLSIFLSADALEAANLKSGFSETLIATGLSRPTAMSFAPDGRVFVCQQSGQVRVIKDGALLAASFISLDVDASGERGLLGVAFHPNFVANQFVYLYYTAKSPALHNRVSRFTANGDVVVPGSEQIILDLNLLTSATNHNGGAMHFGQDGKLYIAVGENATGSNSQTLSNLLGKILRINPDGSIPADNPFYQSATGTNRAIWALGLRNPFTFAFHPFTQRLFINDVGQNTWEEINDGIAGANYGWPNSEGPTTNPAYRSPIHYYGHGSGTTLGCAITGGTFYNPSTSSFPAEYVGDYFFADYCNGWINQLDPTNGNTVSNFATGISSPVDLRVDDSGSLYYLARGSGTNTGVLYKIQYASSQPPVITQQPSNQTVSEGQSASFSVSASGTQPINYQWQRNAANIPNATASTYTIAAVVFADNGASFRCLVSNSFGSTISSDAILTVTTNRAPMGSIVQPAAGTLYSAGQTIGFAGTATDPEQGNLSPAAFTWRADFHHDSHTHPFLQPTSGVSSGSFTIPTSGETSTNVWYRIHLTVTDSAGLTHSSFRDVFPRVVTLTLGSDPTGLQVLLDGQVQPTPYSFPSVVGMIRSIGAASPQTLAGATYQFRSWSDGGSATHNITTPSANTSYTAVYRKRGKK
jgi:glucose/arabinose dehydrogenase